MKAINLWEQTFPGTEIAQDFAGREMHKSDYGKPNSKFGWNKDHILPKKFGNANGKGNITICNIKTNSEKGSDYPNFKANNRSFVVKEKENEYEIVEITTTKTNKEKQSSKIREYYNNQILIGLVAAQKSDKLTELINLVFEGVEISESKFHNTFFNNLFAMIKFTQPRTPKTIKKLFDKCMKVKSILDELFSRNISYCSKVSKTRLLQNLMIVF